MFHLARSLYRPILLVLAILSTSLYAQMGTQPIGIESAMDASTSGMIAQRIRLAVVAENVANISTWKVEETGEPYRKKYAVLEPYKGGVRVKSIENSKEPLLSYPDGQTLDNTNGQTLFPNVSLPEEMLTLSYTETMYEANVTCFKTSKALYQSLVDTLK